LIQDLGGRPQSSWSTPGYPKSYGGGGSFGAARRHGDTGDFADRLYNYEDENQEAPRSPAIPSRGNGFGAGVKTTPSKPFVASWMTSKAKPEPTSLAPESKEGSTQAQAPEAGSIDNIARFFGGKSGHGKPGSLPRPASSHPAPDMPRSSGATGLKKGQRVRHSKYGEGTILMREGDGEDAKLTVLFSRHGMKKLMERFANLQRI
jgi:DNA helicase-2/ATP-dependent DNA helicase PcrA